MSLGLKRPAHRLTGHALRNANLCKHSLRRAESAPPLARAIVTIRAKELGLTRMELARRSGISRGTLRDLELGIHHPTRRLLGRLLEFFRRCQVRPELLQRVRELYSGPPGTLQELIRWLEVQAGSARELARRVGISPSTLWEYRRGHFPMPLSLVRQLCEAVDEDPAGVEPIWLEAERRRLRERGYPGPLADFWALCHRSGLSEKDLPGLGISTATLRRLRYLELPPWEGIARAARTICRSESEYQQLREGWTHACGAASTADHDQFGPRIMALRQKQGIRRREIANLFGIGGKKPAQAVKQIEEGGAFSLHAYPAGLAAVLAEQPAERDSLVRCWEARRRRFLLRHRPETWIDLRLRREAFGLRIADMEAILGYPPLEYQRIERGITRLSASARERILAAVTKAGQAKVAALLERRRADLQRRASWTAPPSIATMLQLLAERAGGLVPLTRALKQAGIRSVWPGRLKSIRSGMEVPPWPVLARMAAACGVADLSAVQSDWRRRYRAKLEAKKLAPISVEVRLLIGTVATSARAISPRIGVSYPVLTRDLKRLDMGQSVRWQAIERILQAVGIAPHSAEWQRVEAWWLSIASDRHLRAAVNGRPFHA